MQQKSSLHAKHKISRGNCRSIPSEIDQALVSHLLSADRFQGISYLLSKNKLPSDIDRKRLFNRLFNLRKLQAEKVQDFVDLCHSYNLPVASSKFEDKPITAEEKKQDFSPSTAPTAPTHQLPTRKTTKSMMKNDVGSLVVTQPNNGIFL